MTLLGCGGPQARHVEGSWLVARLNAASHSGPHMHFRCACCLPVSTVSPPPQRWLIARKCLFARGDTLKEGVGREGVANRASFKLHKTLPTCRAKSPRRFSAVALDRQSWFSKSGSLSHSRFVVGLAEGLSSLEDDGNRLQFALRAAKGPALPPEYRGGDSGVLAACQGSSGGPPWRRCQGEIFAAKG